MRKINGECVAKSDNNLIIEGKAGELECIIEAPLVECASKIIFVMCHPHPQFQGSMQNKVVTTTTKAMRLLGLRAVRFNFRGVGKSQGGYGEGAGELEDLLSILSYVANHYPQHQLWVGGFSFGGYIAYCAATIFPNIKQLLTIAPGVEHFDFLTQAEPTMPWTIIQGDMDEIVPPKMVYAFLATVQVSYHFIKLAGVGHFFHQQLITLKTELLQHYAPRMAQ